MAEVICSRAKVKACFNKNCLHFVKHPAHYQAECGRAICVSYLPLEPHHGLRPYHKVYDAMCVEIKPMLIEPEEGT